MISSEALNYYRKDAARCRVALAVAALEKGNRVRLPAGSEYREATVRGFAPGGVAVLAADSGVLLYRREADLVAA